MDESEQGSRFREWHREQELEAVLAGMENGGPTAEIRAGATDSKPVPLGRRILGFAMAAVILGLAGWILFFMFKPVSGPRAPDFEDISAFGESDIAQIDAWLLEQVERSHFPSLSVAIVRDGKTVYQGAFGFENTWAETRATTNTSYHVASVTKAFTASLAVLLHARGVVDLDQPVVKYLPEGTVISDAPELGAGITLRQLASHTSGLPRRVPGVVQSVEGRYQLEPERLYALLPGVTLEFEPGAGDRYSNLGFGLLGHALERAAKQPLDQLIQEFLCEPLHLERTAIHVDEDLPVATGYTTPPRLPESHSYRRRLAGSGGLVTSAGDLAKFLTAHMQPGLFTADRLTELHAATLLKNGAKSTHALGWTVDESNPIGRILTKNGGRGNASAWIGFSPEHRVGVAVIANIGRPDVDPIGRWLLERSVGGGVRPTSERGHAKAAPFTGVRWENDRPIVRVQGRWSPLVSIDGIPIEGIMEFARKEFRDSARMRFGEDLPQVLAAMGHHPDWEVTLGLESREGRVEPLKVRMTEANRKLVRDARLDE